MGPGAGPRASLGKVPEETVPWSSLAEPGWSRTEDPGEEETAEGLCDKGHWAKCHSGRYKVPSSFQDTRGERLSSCGEQGH